MKDLINQYKKLTLEDALHTVLFIFAMIIWIIVAWIISMF